MRYGMSNLKRPNSEAASIITCLGMGIMLILTVRLVQMDMLAMLNKYLGTDVQPEFSDPRPGDILESLADISAARRALSYAPQVDFEEGIAQSIDYYRSLKNAVT